MGFINKAISNALRIGRKVKNVAGIVGPYAKAAIQTIAKNPEFIPQLAGLVGGGIGLAGEVAGGALTGGATAVPALGTGAALMAAGKKTFGDISKAYKDELKSAKGKKKIAFTADDVAALREAKAQLGKAKKIMKDSQGGVNINE